MGQFKTLFWYEFCKIIKRRSTWLTLAVLVVLLVFMDTGNLFGGIYVDGVLLESHAQAIQKDRANGRALSGRLLGDSLLAEMQEGQKRLAQEEMPKFMFTEEYAKYIRAYRPISYVVEGFGADPGSTDETGLYQARRELLETHWREYGLSQEETAYWQKKEEQLGQPFPYQYGDGWWRLISYDFYMLGIMAAFFASICMTGVFYEDHSRKTDQLILCSRLGRKQLYLVRLCAGSLFSLCAGLLLFLVSLACELGTFGPEGFSAMIQLFWPQYSYPLVLGKMALIMAGLFFLISIFYGAFSMVLSEAAHSQVGAMATVIVVVVLQRLLPIPASLRGLSQLWNYLPANLLSLERQGVFDPRLVSMPGVRLTVWQLAPILYIGAILLLGLLGRRVYCRYQVQGR